MVRQKRKWGLAIAFPAPDEIWSTNQRLHWARQAELVRTWRGTAKIEAQQYARRHRLDTPLPGPVAVMLELFFTENRRRDGHNYVGTVAKAIVDGLVDAGYFPDDTNEHVEVIQPAVVANKGLPIVIVRLMWRDW